VDEEVDAASWCRRVADEARNLLWPGANRISVEGAAAENSRCARELRTPYQPRVQPVRLHCGGGNRVRCVEQDGGKSRLEVQETGIGVGRGSNIRA